MTRALKTRQINLRLDETSAEQLRTLSDVTGNSASNVLRELIETAYKKLTPTMRAELEKQRVKRTKVRERVLG